MSTAISAVVARTPSVVTGQVVAAAAWIVGSLAGWLLFGVIGAVIALLYLAGPRRRMNALRR
jgi:hypothetical protein